MEPDLQGTFGKLSSERLPVADEMRELFEVTRSIYVKLASFKPAAIHEGNIENGAGYSNITFVAPEGGGAPEPWFVHLNRHAIYMLSDSRGMFEFFPKQAKVARYDRSGDNDIPATLSVFKLLDEELSLLLAGKKAVSLEEVHNWFLARGRDVLISARIIDPRRFEELEKRLVSVSERASQVAPLNTVSEEAFVSTVSRALRTRFSELKRLTGQERTWKELASHGGIDGSCFDRQYAGTKGMIDLGYVLAHPMDHGFDAIRNHAYIRPRKANEGFAFEISPDGYELTTPADIPVLGIYLDMYEVFLEAGLPVIFDRLATIINEGFSARVAPCDLLPEHRRHASGYALSPVDTTSPTQLVLDFDSYFELKDAAGRDH